MAQSLVEIGADIFLVQLLDPELCAHIIQIAECKQFQPAGIELGTLDTQVRSNDLLRLGAADPLLISTNQLLLGQLAIIQRQLYQHYGINSPMQKLAQFCDTE